MHFFQTQSRTLLRPQAYDRIENGISGESRKRKMILNPQQGLQASYFITNRASSILTNGQCSQNQLISFWQVLAGRMGKLLENRSQFGTICNTRYQHITAAKPQATPNRSDQGLRQNSGMDRPAVIQTYGKVWITCVLVWIGGMDRRVGSGYGSGLYILTHSRRFRLFLHAADAHAGTQACRHAGTQTRRHTFKL